MSEGHHSYVPSITISEVQESYPDEALQSSNVEQPKLSPERLHADVQVRNVIKYGHDVEEPDADNSDGSDGCSSATPDEENVGHQRISDQPEVRDFKQYCKESMALENRLENLTNSVQTLGSALGLWKASVEVHQLLVSVREIFVEIAKNLYPKLELDDGKKRRSRSSRKDLPQTMGSGNYYLRLSTAFESLSTSVEKFSTALDDFPDFTDHVGRKALSAFAEEIKSRSSILARYAKQEDSVELKRFVLHLGPEMGEHMESISTALKTFMEIGIRCISFSQKRTAGILLNAATVATFFSGVTATTLQYSIGDPKLIAVNTCWFSSLVLSIACAVNSLLAMTWRQALFSTPTSKVPWWVQIWIKQSYLVFLAAAVMTFLGGLLCYVIETQETVAIWAVVASSIVTVFGLTAVTFWFGWERWVFSHESRRNWLRNAQQDIQDQRLFHYLRYYIERFWKSREKSLPKTTADLESPVEKEKQPQYQARTGRVRRLTMPSRFAKDSRLTPPSMHTPSKRMNTSSRQLGRGNGHVDDDPDTSAVYKIELKRMVLKGPINQGHGRIRQLQFSPSGQWLVTCGRHACMVYKNGPALKIHQNIKHSATSHVKQAEWSPNGRALLTRSRRSYKVWNIGNDDKFRTISKFSSSAHSMRWLNDDELLVLTSDSLATLDLSGKTIEKFSSREDLSLEEMSAINSIKESTRVLVIANQGGPSSKGRPIKCILLIDLSMDFIRQDFPLAGEARNLSASKDGQYVLISYADQPPEIWRVNEEVDRIALLHPCVAPKGSTREKSWGTASFVGPSDNYVVCPADGGEIHLWERGSGIHLHKLSPQDGAAIPSEVSVIAWVPPGVLPMVVSAAGDSGTLTIYRAAREDYGGTSRLLPHQSTSGQASGSQEAALSLPPVSWAAPQTSEHGSGTLEQIREPYHGPPASQVPPTAGASKRPPSIDGTGVFQFRHGFFKRLSSVQPVSRHERGPTDEQDLLPEIAEPATTRPKLLRRFSRAAGGRPLEGGQ